MTCIVGYSDGKKVWIGADSCASNEWMSGGPCLNRKVFRNGHCLIGYTTSFRMGQIIEYGFQAPSIAADRDPLAYIVADFIPELQKAFGASRYDKDDQGRSEGGTFLVGCHGRLFQVHDDYCVLESAISYDACGSGADVAKGALHAILKTAKKVVPETALIAALEAASNHNRGVCAPFHVSSI